MKRFLKTLRAADAARPLFQRGVEFVRAGEVRAMAAHLAGQTAARPGDLHVHVESAAHFTAALLAASLLNRAVILPAHTQPAYLGEIGCATAKLLRDDAFSKPAADAPTGAFDAAADDIPIVFFTSGSTGAPKCIETTLSRLETEAGVLQSVWGDLAGHVRGTVSHQHIYGLLYRVLWPLLSERTTDDRAALYWEEFDGGLGDNVTLISSPAHLTRLPPFTEKRKDAPGLVISSGQLLPFNAAQDCKAWLGQAPVEVLGSTETGGIAWRRQDEQDEPWTAFPVVHVSAGENGALQVRSPYLMGDAPQRTGDALDLLPDGRFRLRAREDRIEKIDGKRVSLARVEAGLRALPEIAAAVSLTLPSRKQALSAVVVLTLQGQKALEQTGAFRLSRSLRSALSKTLEPAERPKHWRFVDAIPSDSQGKHVLSTLRALFETDPLATLDFDISMRNPDEAEIRFSLPPELIYFKGHFPTRPILPGLAQVHMAHLFAEKLWAFDLHSSDLSRLKCRRVLRPHDEILLRLTFDKAKGVLRFKYTLGDIDASEGALGAVPRTS